MLRSLISRLINYRIFNIRYGRRGGNLHISRQAVILGKRQIRLGDSITILEFSKIDARTGTIEIGNKCHIDRNVLIATYGGAIRIGNRTSLNPNCCVYGHGGLTIGNFVRIAANTVIIPGNHGFSRIDIPICDQVGEKIGITIEDDVWIGANCVILDGVTIGHSSVIGAGSVVTRSVEAFSIMGGVPAKLIRKRTSD